MKIPNLEGRKEKEDLDEIKEFQKLSSEHHYNIEDDPELKYLQENIEKAGRELPEEIKDKLNGFLGKVEKGIRRSENVLSENKILASLLGKSFRNARSRRRKARQEGVFDLLEKGKEGVILVKVGDQERRRKPRRGKPGKKELKYYDLGAVQIVKRTNKDGEPLYKIVKCAGNALKRRIKEGSVYMLRTLPKFIKDEVEEADRKGKIPREE